MSSPWKHPETGVYYFKRKVPADVVEAVGKSWFKKSLRTKDLSEAKRLIVPLIAESDELIRMARLRKCEEARLRLTRQDAAIIASRWYERMKEKINENGGDVGLVSKVVNENGSVSFEGLSDHLLVTGSDIHRATQTELDRLGNQLGEFIEEQLQVEALKIDKESDPYRWLAREFFFFIYELEGLCRARLVNDWTYRPADSIAEKSLSLDKTEKNGSKSPSVEGKGPLLSELLVDYCKSEEVKLNGDLSRLKTVDGYALAFNRLIEVIGDVPVGTVTRQNIMKFRDTLLKMPKSKKSEVRDMSVEDQVRYAENNGLELLSTSSVNKSIRYVSAVFGYAVESEFIDASPTRDVRKIQAKKVTEAEELYRGYSREEVSTIFSHSLFNDASCKKTHGWASYWVPLLCRYTGARLNEIGQLRKSDIGEKDGIPVIIVRRGEGRSVKTDSSVRLIPIHSHIIDLGFLDFVNDCKTDLIFPKVPLDKYGKAGTALSKWWGKLVRDQGVDPKAPAHEFRHTIKTELRDIGVNERAIDLITGHAALTVGGSYGSVSLSTRKNELDKLYPLEIPRIYKEK